MEAKYGLKLAHDISRQLSHGWYSEQIIEFCHYGGHCCFSKWKLVVAKRKEDAIPCRPLRAHNKG